MTDVVIQNDPASNEGNGEEACEGHDYNEEECSSIGCCHWNDGQCWSSVGQDQCTKDGFRSGCSVPIVSVNHKVGAKVLGQYFNFDRKWVKGLGNGQTLRFV